VLHDDARFSLEQAVRAHERMTGRALQLAAVNGAVIALVVDAVDGPTPLTLEPVSVVGAGESPSTTSPTTTSRTRHRSTRRGTRC
jgi:hypothetical protein